MQPPTKEQLDAAVAKRKKAKKGDKANEELEKLAALPSKVEQGEDAAESANIRHPSASQSRRHVIITLGPDQVGGKEMIESVPEEPGKQGSQRDGQEGAGHDSSC